MRPTSGPNDAGSGSAVRQATGWDCGNGRECGGVRIFATALKKNPAESIESAVIVTFPKISLLFRTRLFLNALNIVPKIIL